MKKYLQVCGLIFNAIVIIGVIIGVLFFVRLSAHLNDAKAYVDSVAPGILQSMGTDTLFKYSTDQLKSSNTRDQIEHMLKGLSADYGTFKKCEKSDGRVNVQFVGINSLYLIGNLEVHAEFENTTAIVNFSIIKGSQKHRRITGGYDWQIQSFSFRKVLFD